MKRELGQVFTPKFIVEKMISLITISNPKILEPSSGNGAFYYELIRKFDKNNITAIELDNEISHPEAKIIDFFDLNGKFDVIIGNPPYVEFKDILDSTLSKIKSTELKHKPNLYMFFLEKSLKMLKDDGELIFIIPTEWLMASSFENIITKIFFEYSIQYFEVIPENVWEDASVTTAIVKIKKGSGHNKISYFISTNKKIIMGERPKIKFNGRVTVKVGAASGNNKKYQSNDFGQEFIFSSTERTGEKIKMRYLDCSSEWIRKIPIPPKFNYQIFVNSKTRKEKPFYFIPQDEGKAHMYDASVLCIYCDMNLSETKKLINSLNSLNWGEMGIKRNGKFNFTQSILEGVLNG